MTKTTRKFHRIIAVIAGGSVALGAYSFGVSSSPGSTRGAGFSTSPGRSVAVADLEQHPPRLALTQRKAGSGQHDYL